ncbi:hypothetical protein FOA52_011128 [Chlamydomonas sp. UWO 241]|nr:hypothetical protein FOA52_011128 [Chlamydomonas sp. UWO 241]
MAADDEYASAHAVLLSEDLLHQQLSRWLDSDAKAALRVVCKGTRSLVDGAVQVVASPSSGASAIDLASALLHWPAVRDLTLFHVTDATDLSPLSTASLAGLTSLTVRQEVTDTAWDMPAPSISVAATLRVIDISGCYYLRSIDFVRGCVQLRMAVEFASAHADLLSEDLLHQQLWRWLDADAKAAMRVVCKGMCSLVDGAVQVVSSPRSGASAGDLASALLRWPAVEGLTLLCVRGAIDMSPLSTATLAGLTSLTVREDPHTFARWDIPAPSSSVAATLGVVDISSCRRLRSIDFVRSCVQLRCLWMPWCCSVSDLSPLGTCSETLEELWMAFPPNITSLAPLAACTKLRKLDLRGCSSVLTNQVEGLQLACPQLAAPKSVEFEGLVHELLPNMPADSHWAAADALWHLAARGVENQAAITSAGAIPALGQLLNSDSPGVPAAAARALRNLGA